MTKIYTVKSNARRDAKKLGFDVSVVVACEGGWTIAEPAKDRKKPEGAHKLTALANALAGGWTPLPSLMSDLGWQAHTIRGAISTLAKKQGLKIERQRDSGVTSYRIAA